MGFCLFFPKKLSKEVGGEADFILKVESKHPVWDILRFEAPTRFPNPGIK